MVRERRATDIPALLAILRAAYEHDGYPTNWPRDPALWVIGASALGSWVAEHDGALAGHVALSPVAPDRNWPEWQEALQLPADRLAVIRRLFIDPGRRRRRLATDLAEHAEREATRLGRHPVLDVAEHNQGAVDFWLRRGWRQVGRAVLPPGDEGRALRVLLLVKDVQLTG